MSSSIDSSRKTLLNGTIIYFIGNVLTQIISILLLKFVTGAVSTSEYGYFNLVVTVDNLVTPMITLQISDAVFRFFIKAKSETDRKYIYSSGTTIIVAGAALVCVAIMILKNPIGIQYPVWVALYVISTNIFGYNQKVVRSLKQNRLYVIANLLKSLIYFLFMVIFVLRMKMGVKGLLMANSLSTYLCIGLLATRINTLSYFRLKYISLEWMKKMVRFSAPLIPNTAVWWLQSSINSLLISSRIGLDYNGIYSVSIKFASVLNLVITVFNLAWQESAITEYGSENYRYFASDTLDKYIQLLLSAVAVLIPVLRLAVPYLIDKQFYDAIQYIPFLLLSTAFSAFSGYFAQMITAQNRNERLLTTNLLGAVANISIMFLLLRPLGIWAVVISSMVSNLLLSGSRFYEVRVDIDNKSIHWGMHAFLFWLCGIQCCLYLRNNTVLTICSLCVVAAICVYINAGFIKGACGLLLNKFKK